MKTKHKLTNTIGLTAIGGLILLGLILLSPNVSNEASAESLTSTLSTKTTANLYSMISLSLSESIDIDLTPKSSGEISFGVAELKVATNNTTGYSIMLSTVDQSNELKAVDTSQHYTGQEDVEYSIKPLTSSTTAADYLGSSNNLNTWGYALTNGTSNAETVYNGLSSANGDTVYTTRSTSSNDSYNLNIAVAVDADLPAGQYRNGIVVSAVANPLELRGFNEIYYMQEMTPDVCSRATIGDEGQLVDKRDRTIYWVAKLKDNNCWMTQNLDLDLSTDVALTPEDSDVTKPWTPTSSTNAISLVDGSLDDNDYSNSWDFGKEVVLNPTEGTPRHENVNSGWSATFSAGEVVYDGNLYTYLTVNQANKTYDAHYLIGNLYQYGAATAGSDSTVNTLNETVPDSICPKGWRLPANGFNASTSSPIDSEKSFDRLLLQYGLPNGVSIYEFTGEGAKFDETLAKSPLYLARTGGLGYNKTLNIFTRLIDRAVYSSNTVHGSTSVLVVYLESTAIRIPNGSPRTEGETIRCIAK